MTMILRQKYSIYPLESETGKLFLYAPLVGILAETSHEEVSGYEQRLKAEVVPEDLAELICYKRVSEDLLPDNTSELTILINQKCNFSCKYCYSANGRSNAELPEPLFEPLVKWFVNPSKRGKKLNVTFSGGGDPTLSFEKVRRIITMMRERASNVDAEVSFGMVCNGSRIANDDIEFIRTNFANLVISFDVIPDVHDSQRSHYSVVTDSMRNLIDAGVKFGLRSTITELNVDRMEEMVRVLHHDFPECRSLAVEAVLVPEMWESNSQLISFYTRFINNYFKAQTLADNLGISLGNTIELSSDGLKGRACEGKVVVTPNGKLTACSRIATLGDNHFSDFVFGHVTETGVDYDSDKYQSIMSIKADNIFECQDCFARYHCGGGCMLARLSYSPEQMKIHCDFTRKILKHKLFNELDR